MEFKITQESKFEQAVRSPTLTYKHPSELLQDFELSDEEKLEILTTWKSEAEHIQTSEDEGLDGGERSHLDAIDLAIKTLSSS